MAYDSVGPSSTVAHGNVMTVEPGSIAPGTTLGRYWIERSVGRGGMGTVFLAYDTELRRQVALKVLDKEVGGATPRAQLLREARSAAVLTHPNVCAIHEVAEIDGTAFIAMAYASGRSLRDRLDAAGALPLLDTVRLGVQAADALGYAHERDVVHRDFKAANAIVDDTGHLTIVDFGIAQRTDALMANVTAAVRLPAIDAAAGTPYAMAPEQVRGQSLDGRTDIWALGVLLYEMVTGAAPFRASTTADLFAAILTQAPAPLPASLPVELRTIIERCLAKDPQRRYQQASDVRTALAAVQASLSLQAPALQDRRWLPLAATFAVLAVLLVGLSVDAVRDRIFGGGPGAAPIRLAVLPFDNLTNDPEQDYFSDGLTDDMITQLGRLHPQRLSVIARASTMPYKGGAVSIPTIGRELDVDYVLQGSARREGSRVRINATLVRVSDQTQRWAESYDRELASILTLQNDVARGVARALAFTLLPAEEACLANERAVNPEAYEAYLKGQFHADKLTQADLDLAEMYFETALARDPTYAAAYAGLSGVWAGRNQMGYLAPSAALPPAKDAALTAIRLDDTLPAAHYALGLVAWSEWDWQTGAAELRRAIELNPNDSRAPPAYSYVLAAVGRKAEAVEQAEHARRLDPLSALNQASLGMILYFDRRYDEAIAELQGALVTAAELPFAHCGLWHAFAMTGRFDEALRPAEGCVGHYSLRVGAVLREGFAAGGYREAMHRVAEVLAAGVDGVYVAPIDVASAYLHAAENEHALDWLARSVDVRDPNAFGIAADPQITDKLGADPRLAELLRRMALPAARLE